MLIRQFTFHSHFYIVRQLWKEVVTCNLLHLVYRAWHLVCLIFTATILTDKSVRTWLTLHYQYHLEEGIGYSHLVFTNGFVLIFVIKYRSTSNINLAIFTSPHSTFAFYIAPRTTIDTEVLRTNIGKQETLIHRFLIPLVITCRTHMPPTPTTLFIVVVRSTWFGHFLIFVKSSFRTSYRTFRMFSC